MLNKLFSLASGKLCLLAACVSQCMGVCLNGMRVCVCVCVGVFPPFPTTTTTTERAAAAESIKLFVACVGATRSLSNWQQWNATRTWPRKTRPLSAGRAKRDE